jgi:ArsR family transcriptional regulator
MSIQNIDISRYNDAMSARTARQSLENEFCCDPVSAEVLDPDQAEALAGAFAALADPTRLRLFSMVASAAGGEVCACDLVEPSGRSQPTISHHMKILLNAGLITGEKRSLWVWYRVIPERLAALRTALA